MSGAPPVARPMRVLALAVLAALASVLAPATGPAAARALTPGTPTATTRLTSAAVTSTATTTTTTVATTPAVTAATASARTAGSRELPGCAITSAAGLPAPGPATSRRGADHHAPVLLLDATAPSRAPPFAG